MHVLIADSGSTQTVTSIWTFLTWFGNFGANTVKNRISIKHRILLFTNSPTHFGVCRHQIQKIHGQKYLCLIGMLFLFLIRCAPYPPPKFSCLRPSGARLFLKLFYGGLRLKSQEMRTQHIFKTQKQTFSLLPGICPRKSPGWLSFEQNWVERQISPPNLGATNANLDARKRCSGGGTFLHFAPETGIWLYVWQFWSPKRCKLPTISLLVPFVRSLVSQVVLRWSCGQIRTIELMCKTAKPIFPPSPGPTRFSHPAKPIFPPRL